MGIRIILADDHQITRQGLISLLEKENDMEVIAEAEDGRAALKLVRENRPDIVIMDVTMPGLNGMEATRQIKEIYNDVKVIALSMHSDGMFITEMLKSGASGYLLKDCAFEELAKAIRTVKDKKVYLSPSISSVVVEGYLSKLQKNNISSPSNLTDREREILQLIAEGQTTKQIALNLHISVKTVETHRRQIMNKLDIHNIADLTKYAIRKGLTTLDS